MNRLAVSIIHSISNPLSIIIGNAQYLLLSQGAEEGQPPAHLEEIAGTVQAILNETTRLTGLVSQLLSFSSKVAGEEMSDEEALFEFDRLMGRLSDNTSERISFDSIE